MMDMSEKVIAVIGATGQQGGSVARRFLQSGNFHVRALTRSPTSPAAQALASLGAEIVRTDLFDIASLKEAVRGVNVVFSVTNYWAPFAPNQIEDSRRKAKELGMNSVREYAGYLEEAAGRNIADAVAATAETLEGHGKGFLVSTLSHAKECSKGRFEKLYHFDAKAKVFPGYVEEKYPELVNKMSSVQTGFFFGSHLILPDSYLAKVSFNALWAHTQLVLADLSSIHHRQRKINLRCVSPQFQKNRCLIWILSPTWANSYTRYTKQHHPAVSITWPRVPRVAGLNGLPHGVEQPEFRPSIDR